MQPEELKKRINEGMEKYEQKKKELDQLTNQEQKPEWIKKTTISINENDKKRLRTLTWELGITGCDAQKLNELLNLIQENKEKLK